MTKVENSGFRLFTSEEEAEQAFRSVLNISVDYAQVKLPDPSVSVAFVLEDDVFPFTGNSPASFEQPGYLWHFQVGQIGQGINHTYLHNKLTDEDRTFTSKEFNLVFCPNQKGTRRILDSMISNCTMSSQKARIVLIGVHAFKVLTTTTRNNVEQELREHGDLMRHMVEGNVDVAPVVRQKVLSEIGAYPMPIDPVSAKYCPTCKASAKEVQ